MNALINILRFTFRQKMSEKYNNIEDNVDEVKREYVRKVDQLEYRTKQQESRISELSEMVSNSHLFIFFFFSFLHKLCFYLTYKLRFYPQEFRSIFCLRVRLNYFPQGTEENAVGLIPFLYFPDF